MYTQMLVPGFRVVGEDVRWPDALSHRFARTVVTVLRRNFRRGPNNGDPADTGATRARRPGHPTADIACASFGSRRANRRRILRAMRYASSRHSQEIADEVRRTRAVAGLRAPGASGNRAAARARAAAACEPSCRAGTSGCLFTYRPPAMTGQPHGARTRLHHAEHCEAFAGDGFPEGLRALPLAFEARATGSRVLGCQRAPADVRRRRRSRCCSGRRVALVACASCGGRMFHRARRPGFIRLTIKARHGTTARGRSIRKPRGFPGAD